MNQKIYSMSRWENLDRIETMQILKFNSKTTLQVVVKTI